MLPVRSGNKIRTERNTRRDEYDDLWKCVAGPAASHTHKLECFKKRRKGQKEKTNTKLRSKQTEDDERLVVKT